MGGLSSIINRIRGRQNHELTEPEPEPVPTQEGGRAQWASATEFLLTCIGYSVGLGNVWRFPYLCYKSGGGAFLIPYIIFITLIGCPLLFMEYSFGQYFGIGGLSIFKRVCPLFQGIGIGYIVLNALVCIYYNVIIGLALYYLFASFTSELPWGKCGQWWNTPYCGDPIKDYGNSTYWNSSLGLNGTMHSNMSYVNGTLNGTLVNMTKRTSPSEEYWKHALLAVTDEHSIDNIGSVRWHICLCLLLAWLFVVMFVCKGIRSTGKVVYFTATFPYVMLTVLVVRGVTLPGATKGILYFITPNFEKLKNPEVWFGAATQLFYSTNLAWGGMITMASYNDFKHNCYRDAVVINIVSFLTSLYAGFAVFSVIGYMANEYGVDIEKVIDSGPGLAFIVYPRALGLMPLAPMWSFLFFFMLFLLGIGSQIVLIETCVTGFVDEFPILGKNTCIRLFTTIGMVSIFFLLGIPLVTQIVIIETVVTGFVDEFPVLGRNACVRLITTLVMVVIFFMLGIPLVTQMVQVETVITGLVDEFPRLGKNWRVRLGTTTLICVVGFFLGLPCATQMVDFETVMSGLCDEFAFFRKHRFVTAVCLAIIFFLLGLPQVTQGGMYVLQLMDWYSAGFCVMVIAIFEAVGINWLYGNAKFVANVKEMLGYFPQPRMWWRICWMFISPMLIFAVLMFKFIDYKRATYGDYNYPLWADMLGWVMSLSSVMPIFAVAIYKFIRAEGSTWSQKWRNVIRPRLDDRGSEIEIKSKDVNKPKENDVKPNSEETEAQRAALLKEQEATESNTKV